MSEGRGDRVDVDGSRPPSQSPSGSTPSTAAAASMLNPSDNVILALQQDNAMLKEALDRLQRQLAAGAASSPSLGTPPKKSAAPRKPRGGGVATTAAKPQGEPSAHLRDDGAPRASPPDAAAGVNGPSPVGAAAGGGYFDDESLPFSVIFERVRADDENNKRRQQQQQQQPHQQQDTVPRPPQSEAIAGDGGIKDGDAMPVVPVVVAPNVERPTEVAGNAEEAAPSSSPPKAKPPPAAIQKPGKAQAKPPKPPPNGGNDLLKYGFGCGKKMAEAPSSGSHDSGTPTIFVAATQPAAKPMFLPFRENDRIAPLCLRLWRDDTDEGDHDDDGIRKMEPPEGRGLSSTSRKSFVNHMAIGSSVVEPLRRRNELNVVGRGCPVSFCPEVVSIAWFNENFEQFESRPAYLGTWNAARVGNLDAFAAPPPCSLAFGPGAVTGLRPLPNFDYADDSADDWDSEADVGSAENVSKVSSGSGGSHASDNGSDMDDFIASDVDYQDDSDREDNEALQQEERHRTQHRGGGRGGGAVRELRVSCDGPYINFTGDQARRHPYHDREVVRVHCHVRDLSAVFRACDLPFAPPSRSKKLPAAAAPSVPKKAVVAKEPKKEAPKKGPVRVKVLPPDGIAAIDAAVNALPRGRPDMIVNHVLQQLAAEQANHPQTTTGSAEGVCADPVGSLSEGTAPGGGISVEQSGASASTTTRPDPSALYSKQLIDVTFRCRYERQPGGVWVPRATIVADAAELRAEAKRHRETAAGIGGTAHRRAPSSATGRTPRIVLDSLTTPQRSRRTNQQLLGQPILRLALPAADHHGGGPSSPDAAATCDAISSATRPSGDVVLREGHAALHSDRGWDDEGGPFEASGKGDDDAFGDDDDFAIGDILDDVDDDAAAVPDDVAVEVDNE